MESRPPAILDCPICAAPMLRPKYIGRRHIIYSGQPAQLELDQCPSCEAQWFPFDVLEQFMGAPRGALLVSREGAIAPNICARCGYPNPAEETICRFCIESLRYRCPVDASELEAFWVFGIVIHSCRDCQGLLLPKGMAQMVFDRYRRTTPTGHGSEALLNEATPEPPPERMQSCDRCGFVGLPHNLRPDDTNQILCGHCFIEAHGGTTNPVVSAQAAVATVEKPGPLTRLLQRLTKNR